MSRHAYWISALLFGALVLAKFSSQTGFTGLIRFGETWRDRRLGALQGLPIATVPASTGYDGQFYAQLALDPLLRDSGLKTALDAPVYRARRILVPASAAILGLGHPWWVLQAYALLNVACWVALGWLLRESTLSTGWLGFARWAGCMFGMGVLESVRQSLVDLPALLMLALAIRSAAHSGLGTKASVWLALGSLAKETTLLGTLALHSETVSRQGHRTRAFGLLLLAAIPIGAWSIYVGHRLGGATDASGLGNFTWPLGGLLTQTKIDLTELLRGNFDSRFSFGLLAMLGLTAQFVALWRAPDFKSAWWRIGAAYSLLLPFLGEWVWSGYWAACRALLPMTIAFNLLLPANRAFWPLWAVGNLTLLHALWRFL